VGAEFDVIIYNLTAIYKVWRLSGRDERQEQLTQGDAYFLQVQSGGRNISSQYAIG